MKTITIDIEELTVDQKERLADILSEEDTNSNINDEALSILSDEIEWV